jgi:methionyl-tRNA formyltransferase
LGCINVHASLLPRWRGAAPIPRAIEAGDAETGITIMKMDAGLDTGAMLLAEAIAIDAQDSAGSLHDKLAELGGRLVVAALARFDRLVPVPQAEAGVSYANKIDKAEARLDWRQPAAVLARKLRAFDPFPGATLTLAGNPVKVWRGDVVAGGGRPGQLLAANPDGIVVACAEQALRLTELQKPGGRRVTSADFLCGTPLRPD